MNESITKHDESGRITVVISTDTVSIELNKTGLWVDGLGDRDTDYVLAGQILPRPQNPAVLTGFTLTGLPVPCTITINGIDYACADDHAELELDQPTTYKITIAAWPYLDKEFTLENPAQ